MSEEEPSVATTPDGAEAPKQRRRRRTKLEQEADLAREREIESRAAQADLPPFSAEIVAGRIHATAKRVVRTGNYESFDIMIHADFERDPRHPVQDNMKMLGAMVAQEANRIADQIQSQIQVEK